MFFWVVSGVKTQTGDSSVFRAVLGSLVAVVSPAEIFTPQFTAPSLHSGCESAAGKQTGVWYVFRAVLGGLVAGMRMGDAPGGWKPGKPEIFTPKFTPNGLF